MRSHLLALLLLPALACNTKAGSGDDGPSAVDGNDGTDGTGGTDGADGTDGTDGTEPLCDEGPAPGTVATDPGCEYEPEPSGNPFSAKVEWSMSHELTDPSDGSTVGAYSFSLEADHVGVFQAPAVSQATDDNGDGRVDENDLPDIAVNMGDEFASPVELHSTLRLMSGDGGMHDSISWESFTNANGTDDYAPFLFAGVALADVDLDGKTEVVTTVIGDSSGDCFPATYEVGLGGRLSLEAVGEDELWCQGGSTKSAHAPAVADLDNDGFVEVILGRSVYAGADLALRWEGTGGRGWYHAWFVGADGYWNSGFHSFAYDMDGDNELEVVAGSTVYTADGDVYCRLTSSRGTAADGYPAVADLVGGSGPEIVLTGNQRVSVYNGTPNASGECREIDSVRNDPYLTSIGSSLPTHADCDDSRRSFGGPPTIADFNGDGSREVGVAGACWFTIFDVTGAGLETYALTQTRDWSSASTGATVFDFNGDGVDEVVFSDEVALYVWQIDASAGLQPWQRISTVLEDANHKSWTIHEYPVVSDVDGDGKAEIVVSNSPLPGYLDQYGLYVLGAADDDWVSARPVWNQHAYYITNIEDDFSVGAAAPNYRPYTSEDYNSFRVQAPGSFGALAASDLSAAIEVCQEDCGEPAIVWVQVENAGAYITAGAGLKITLYGQQGGSTSALEVQDLGVAVGPGERSEAVGFELPNWADYDQLIVVVDDPAETSGSADWGAAKECDEDNNRTTVDTSGLCE